MNQEETQKKKQEILQRSANNKSVLGDSVYRMLLPFLILKESLRECVNDTKELAALLKEETNKEKQ